MLGFDSRCAWTREDITLTFGVVDEGSATVLGLEGKRPRRPLRLSVRTTERQKRGGAFNVHEYSARTANALKTTAVLVSLLLQLILL